MGMLNHWQKLTKSDGKQANGTSFGAAISTDWRYLIYN